MKEPITVRVGNGLVLEIHRIGSRDVLGTVSVDWSEWPNGKRPHLLSEGVWVFNFGKYPEAHTRWSNYTLASALMFAGREAFRQGVSRILVKGPGNGVTGSVVIRGR